MDEVCTDKQFGYSTCMDSCRYIDQCTGRFRIKSSGNVHNGGTGCQFDLKRFRSTLGVRLYVDALLPTYYDTLVFYKESATTANHLRTYRYRRLAAGFEYVDQSDLIIEFRAQHNES
jgi:hypothetical protein